MSSNIIEIIDLNYENIFHNFSIAFEKNKFITISGPNNCGKTTLLRTIDNKYNILNSITILDKRLEDYQTTELSKILKCIFPLQIRFVRQTVEDELLFYLSANPVEKDNSKRIKEIAKYFNLTKLLTTSVEKLSPKETVLLQLAISVISKPKILLIDDLSIFFTKKELLALTSTLLAIKEELSLTIIMVTSDLSLSLSSDYVYIINDSNIILEGKPLDVLEKDNILNKAGLNLPFMMDLAVKLRDYDLIKKIELDIEGMIDLLWN